MLVIKNNSNYYNSFDDNTSVHDDGYDYDAIADVMACRVLATNGKITPALLENVKGVE